MPEVPITQEVENEGLLEPVSLLKNPFRCYIEN
jgi:hypothetical protein